MDYRPPSATQNGQYDGSRSRKDVPRGAPTGMPAFQLPQTAQPPVQIPFSDPFHNRDPFLPSSQHRRKDSYGGAPLTPSVGAERAWPTQPGPQYPPSLQHHPSHAQPLHYHHDHARPQLAFDSARRRSLGGAASPPRYGGPLEPPPPPPPFASRNMPPPSPSTSATPSFAGHAPRGPPSNSPFGGPRDLAGFSSRPGGGMSITSLIGNDKSTHMDRSPKAITTQNSPTFRPHPLSPKRARSTSMRSDFGRVQRPLSPRSHAYGPVEYRDERDRYQPPRSDYGQQPILGPSSAPAFRPYQSSPTSGQPVNGAPAPPRPNSQPTATMQQDRPEAWRYAQPESRPPSGFREYQPMPLEQARHTGEEERYARAAFERSRFAEAQPPPSHPQYQPPPPHDDRDPYGRYPYGPPDRRYDHDDRQQLEARAATGPTSSPVAERSGFESRFRHYPGPPQEREREEKAASHIGRRDDDGHPIPRSLLTVSPELNRKGGRSSPLPQAVQGAQPRLIGPGRDPSIKNEFGRMFSGLGSGVGGSGTPTGPFSASGNLTPSRLSPSRFGDAERSNTAEPENIVDGQSLLHRSDRHEPDHKDEIEGVNGRSTPTGQQRGNKRMKTGHGPHHHHHHGHTHHHHHHHHAVPEDIAPNRGGFSTIRFPPNPTGTPTSQPATVHHHHHHHGNHVHATHHHHHTKATPAPPSPKIIVRNNDVLTEAFSKPRTHLGSSLYDSGLSLPPNKRVLVDTKFLFTTTPTTLPSFAGRENSTFTIRVPREYLIPSDVAAADAPDCLSGGLEEICRRRAVWGTDVYTDDSDVVAAAVHDGWIRGDYGEYNADIKGLFEGGDELENGDDAIKPQDSAAAAPVVEETLESRPERPAEVPADRDMHVTVLILPPLKRYAASTRHHLKSRTWGDDHDGMSFKIERIDFVDEPRASRFEERGLKARKRRIGEELRRRREAADVLLGLGKGGVNGVSVGA